MKKLTKFERKMIKLIAEYYPYSPNQVFAVYDKCKSIDITIKILGGSTALGIPPFDLAEIFKI